MAGAQIPTSSTILNSILGYQGVSFTEFATSAQSLIAAGSKVEIGGSWFTFASNDTPNASSWTAIATANTAYITLTPSGTAGSQILTSNYSDTAPYWRTDKQGWYGSAGSIIRYIGGVTKTSQTQYDDAFIIPAFQERTYDSLTVTNDITVGDDLTVHGDLTATGTVSAEQLTSTDDATIAGTLTVNGVPAIDNSVAGAQSTRIHLSTVKSSRHEADIKFLHATSTDTQNVVYDSIGIYGDVSGMIFGCVGLFGATYLHHLVGTAASTFVFYDIDGGVVLTVVDGNAGEIGSTLKVFLFGVLQ